MSRCAVAYHHGDLPAALLAAVRDAITEHGVSGVSLRDVARRAGVSHSAPAHHFGSKAGLLMAFAAEGFRLLAQVMRAEMASQGDTGADAVAQVAATGQAYVRFAVSHRAHFEVMFGEDALIPGDPELAEARKEVYDLLTRSIERAGQAGRLAPGHSPEFVAIAAWALVHGLSDLVISGRIPDRTGRDDPQQLALAVTTLFTQAVMPPGR
jgi:AcrR family transcriptional regulator